MAQPRNRSRAWAAALRTGRLGIEPLLDVELPVVLEGERGQFGSPDAVSVVEASVGLEPTSRG